MCSPTDNVKLFHFVMAALAGWVNRHQQAIIDYLIEENRVYKQQIHGRRLLLSDNDRRRLAAKAKVLGRSVLDEIRLINCPTTQLTIASKYNAVERLRGVLENHRWGEIIDSVDKALGLARSMTYRGLEPSVRKVTKVYSTGVSVAKRVMRDIETRLERTEGLNGWFIKIVLQSKTG